MSNTCTTCTSCAHWSLKRAGRMGALGFGCCAKGPVWAFQSPAHGCAKHSPVDADVLASRVAWINKRDGHGPLPLPPPPLIGTYPYLC